MPTPESEWEETSKIRDKEKDIGRLLTGGIKAICHRLWYQILWLGDRAVTWSD